MRSKEQYIVFTIIFGWFIESGRGGRVKGRWLLFYTLLRNPQLILLRKNRSMSPRENHKATTAAWVMASQVEPSQDLVTQATQELDHNNEQDVVQ